MRLPAPAFPATEPLAVLKSAAGIPVPLKAVTAKGRLEGLLFELVVEQRYENTSAKDLEAVFTFPLPLRAVLLGFDLEIGGRKLEARAVARQEASEDYERAIDAGDTAALIEHDGQGLYTVSLGNLRIKESAVIRYRYGELLDAHDGYVRVGVPTVIAPRYGNPRDAGLEGPAVPGVDLLGEYPFEIGVRRIGADLGGTEMEKAFAATLKLQVPRERTADLILITDGEIYDVAGVVDRAARSGHRLFAIAIGAAPVEALARSLAEKTGGACEFVGPGEDAEGAILRTFKRLRSMPRSLATIDWPAPPSWTAPLPTTAGPCGNIATRASLAYRSIGSVGVAFESARGRASAAANLRTDRRSRCDVGWRASRVVRINH